MNQAIPEDYPSKKEKIMALAKHDATVLSVMRMADFQGIDYLEMLELLVLQLAQEKATLVEMNKTLASTAVQPAPILLPHGATLLDQERDEDGYMVKMPKIEKGIRISLNDFGVASGNYVVRKVKGDTFMLEKEK